VPDTRYLPRPADPPDTEFRETEGGGHALVLEYAPGHALMIEYGDCSFSMVCQCFQVIARDLRPDRSWFGPVNRWLAHAPGTPTGAVMSGHCQCGRTLAMAGSTIEVRLAAVCRAWEHHTITGGTDA
jgi:hypothetical protein